MLPDLAEPLGSRREGSLKESLWSRREARDRERAAGGMRGEVPEAAMVAEITQKVWMLVFYGKRFSVPNPNLVWVMSATGTGGILVRATARTEEVPAEDLPSRSGPLSTCPGTPTAYDFLILIFDFEERTHFQAEAERRKMLFAKQEIVQKSLKIHRSVSALGTARSLPWETGDHRRKA